MADPVGDIDRKAHLKYMKRVGGWSPVSVILKSPPPSWHTTWLAHVQCMWRKVGKQDCITVNFIALPILDKSVTGTTLFILSYLLRCTSNVHYNVYWWNQFSLIGSTADLSCSEGNFIMNVFIFCG